MPRIRRVANLLLYVVFLVCAGEHLQFKAAPNVFLMNAANELSLKCTWKGKKSLSLVQVKSIQIMKETKQGFEEIATLKHPDVTNMTSVQTHPNYDIEVTYWKHQNCFTLSVLFTKPSLTDAGKYTCLAVENEAIGSSFNVNASLNVTLREDCSVDQWYFEPKTYNNRKYYLSKFGALDIDDAISRCVSLGGYLMEVDDKSELKIANDLAANTKVYRAFIAGSDAKVENHWIYPRTGQAITFLKWRSDQPDNLYNEDCLEIGLKEIKDNNDIQCSLTNAFFCEIESTP
ncbi:neurogenic locus Notch protein [Biomphalaria pfeifferi]|uniref:Neurogenic locus Notch protein n=1 Tax=Biomphalaria pfeifferi TaxID=112525 RepID=A0AAD8C7D7_BIOPF|nr:neurogenic locus Notch protein [Biomphalaria pfeifferi]